MNSGAIRNEPIVDDNTPVLQQTPKLIAQSTQNIKDFVNWLLNCIPSKPKMVGEALEQFESLPKKPVHQESHFISMERVKLALKSWQYSIEKMEKMSLNLIYFWLAPSSLL